MKTLSTRPLLGNWTGTAEALVGRYLHKSELMKQCVDLRLSKIDDRD